VYLIQIPFFQYILVKVCWQGGDYMYTLGFELTSLVLTGIDCTYSCKSN